MIKIGVRIQLPHTFINQHLCSIDTNRIIKQYNYLVLVKICFLNWGEVEFRSCPRQYLPEILPFCLITTIFNSRAFLWIHSKQSLGLCARGKIAN